MIPRKLWIRVAGAAVILLFVGTLAFLNRRRRPPAPPPHVHVPPTAAGPAKPVPASAPSPLDAALRDYHRLQEMKSPPAELASAEKALEERLNVLPPEALLALFLAREESSILQVLLRGIDNGLLRDREGFEEALTGTFETLRRPERLEGLAALLDARLRDPGRRARVARALLHGDPGDARLAWAARFAPRDAPGPVREFLWSKVPSPGAIEGLGLLIEADEASRLESLGPRSAVIRALEAAYARTGDAAFKASLERLSR